MPPANTLMLATSRLRALSAIPGSVTTPLGQETTMVMPSSRLSGRVAVKMIAPLAAWRIV